MSSVTVKSRKCVEGKWTVNFSVQGSYCAMGSGTSFTKTYSEEYSTAEGTTWTVATAFVVEQKYQKYNVYVTTWRTFWICGEFMEAVAGWYDTRNPADKDRYETLEVRDSSWFSVMARFGDKDTLKRKHGAAPIVDWAPTNSYRLKKNGVIIVEWTNRLDFVKDKKKKEHANDVRNSAGV